MIRMMDRVRIQMLREAGMTLGQVGREVGVSGRSVQRVLEEPSITSLEEGADCHIDELVLTLIPEPATVSLLALGVLGLVARRRRGR